MTRKDYIKIAAALEATKPVLPGTDIWSSQEAAHVWLRTVGLLGDALQADNDRFDRSRFEAACYGPVHA